MVTAMGMEFLLAPLIGYVGAGTLKFTINSVLSGRPAAEQIGMGGIPSTHNTICATTLFFILLSEGGGGPIAAVMTCIALIVAIDSMDLRQKIGRQVEALKAAMPDAEAVQALRSRIGHKPHEVAAGYGLGLILAFGLVKAGGF